MLQPVGLTLSAASLTHRQDATHDPSLAAPSAKGLGWLRRLGGDRPGRVRAEDGGSGARRPVAPGEAGEHHSSSSETLEEARAEGHREGMEMERDAHERGMEMGAKAHADGMGAKNAGSIPMKKADPPMKMDGHM